MKALRSFSRLLVAIQEAALDPARWPAAVSLLVSELDACDAILYSPHTPPSRGGLWASRGIEAANMESYAAHYIDKDAWRCAYAAPLSTPGLVVSGDRFITPGAMRRTEFYNDFLKPLGIGRLLCGIVLPETREAMLGGVHVSVFRPLEKHGFGDEETQLLELTMPHLQAALNTHCAIGASLAAITEASLDAIASAVIIVNRDCRVIFANAAAVALLKLQNGLTLQQGALAAKNAAATSALRAFVAGLFAVPDATRPRMAFHAIARPRGLPSYACFGQVIRTGTAVHGANEGSRAILFVREPRTALDVCPSILQALFGLTAAEAQLASALASHSSLAAAAAERGITYETARSQLKRIFAKTGCASQVELAVMIGGAVRP